MEIEFKNRRKNRRIEGFILDEETKDIHYDIDQNRIGHTEWDNDDTGSHYDKENNRTGYFRQYKDKQVIFDKSWNRKGYKNDLIRPD